MVEASYSDFLDPKRITPYRPSFTVRALAELSALHPRFLIVFAGNRKLANEWTLRFFAAVQSHQRDSPHPTVMEAAAGYGLPTPFHGGTYYDVLEKIGGMPDTFTFPMLRAALPGVTEWTIRRASRDLRKAEKIFSHPAGAKSFWEKA